MIERQRELEIVVEQYPAPCRVMKRDSYRELTFQFLREYACRLHPLEPLNRNNQLGTNLDEWYAVLSRYVHVHSRKFIPQGPHQHRVAPDVSCIKRVGAHPRRVWPTLAVLLVLPTPPRFDRATLMEQRLIQEFLPREAKAALRARNH